jgi:spermidine synthase
LKVPAYKRLLSYLYPIWIKNGHSIENPELELLMYRGRWQLATRDAVYSDGDKYTPLVTAYKALDKQLPFIKDVLVLGAGLGSAVQVMSKKGYSPSFTLVDSDEQVIRWARELQPPYNSKVKTVVADAQEYLDTDTGKYDLLIVDVFKGRIVPDFVTTENFIKSCRLHIHAGGSFVLNYIVNEGETWDAFQQVLNATFPQHKVITNGINRIIIATV